MNRWHSIYCSERLGKQQSKETYIHDPKPSKEQWQCGTYFDEFKVYSGLIENVLRKEENSAWSYRWGMREQWQWLAQGQTANEKPGYLAAFMLKHLASSPRSSKPKSKVMRYWAWWRTHFLRHVPVYCMDRGRWSTGQPCAGVVVPDRLNDTGNNRAEHADDTSRRDGGQSPLNYVRKTNMKFSLS